MYHTVHIRNEEKDRARLAERCDSGRNAVATKTYCQGYEVALLKVKWNFQDNEGIGTGCISVERDGEPEALAQTQMTWKLQQSRYLHSASSSSKSNSMTLLLRFRLALRNQPSCRGHNDTRSFTTETRQLTSPSVPNADGGSKKA